MSHHAITSPEDHAAVSRLSGLSIADAAGIIEAQTPRLWIRQACQAWGASEPGATIERLGIYAMPDEHGRAIPALLLVIRRDARAKSLPARAAVVMVFREGPSLHVSDQAISPGGTPTIKGRRLD
jgi:hypothetical protein